MNDSEVLGPASIKTQFSVRSTSESPEPVQSILVESVDMVQEQPPPVHVITQMTATKKDPCYEKSKQRDFILSRGAKDFGVSLELSAVCSCTLCPFNEHQLHCLMFIVYIETD